MPAGRDQAHARPGLARRALIFFLQLFGAAIWVIWTPLRAIWLGRMPPWIVTILATFVYVMVFDGSLALYHAMPDAWVDRAPEMVFQSARALALWLATLWLVVGVWRCAVFSTAKGGWGSALIALTSIAVMLPVAWVGQVVAQDVSCMARVAVKEVWGRASEKPVPPGGAVVADLYHSRAKMSYEGSARTLWLVGGIERGTAAEFIDAIEKNPQATTVGLISPGGYVNEMQAIQEEVRKRKLDTEAPERCASACVGIFLAGERRWIGPESRFGLHRAGHECLEDSGPAEEDLQEAKEMRQAGVADWFIQRRLNTPWESIWRPSREEILASGLATGMTSQREEQAREAISWNR